MRPKIVKELFEKIKLSKLKILVIGDIMLDRYIRGTVRRISPEAPVPVLDFEKEKNILGGAGNVAHNLLNLGVDAHLATIIGDDFDGKIIQDLLDGLKINLQHIVVSSNVSTTKKTRFISNANQLLRLDSDSQGFKKIDFNSIEGKIKNNFKNLDCIIISDYDKGVCSPLMIKRIIQLANKNNIPIYIDPKGSNWSKYKNATCLTPNKKEAEDELNIKLINDSDYEIAAKKIREKYKLQSCIITRGKDGMTHISDGKIIHQKVGKVEVYDVSGAGDSVIASISSSFACGIDINNTLQLASFISSKVVQYTGTIPFSMNMVKSKNE